jgi:hypothetical protein
MSKYVIRAPFSVHLVRFETVKEGEQTRKYRREQSYFHGPEPIELSDEDALAHMHKLEPKDDGAKKLFADFHDKQDAAIEARKAQDGNTKSLAAQVSEAVVGALIAAGVIKPKAAA